MDAALEAMHTRMYALLRWRKYRKHLSESLEHLASDNRDDMYKYNMLYTLNVNQHLLTPEFYSNIDQKQPDKIKKIDGLRQKKHRSRQRYVISAKKCYDTTIKAINYLLLIE